jgi:hypothetical protein
MRSIIAYAHRGKFIEPLPGNALTYNNIVTRRLKAGTVKPEEMSIDRHRIGKRVSAATDTRATIEELM